MKHKSLVRLSNIVGIISIIALIYWVFIFICIEVGGLKIFRERITESFGMSIFAILALMGGSLIVNIMFNLTRIADREKPVETEEKKTGSSKLGVRLFIASFPLIFIVLVGGDYLTRKKKERILLNTAASYIQSNKLIADSIADYSFNWQWIDRTSSFISVLDRSSKAFQSCELLVADSVDNIKVYLSVSAYGGQRESDSLAPAKRSFIFNVSAESGEYLKSVFYGNNTNSRFFAHDGNYELFYPYRKGNKVVVYYFSDYQRYGKLGS